MDLAKHCIVQPGSKLRLKHRDPDDTFGRKRNDKAHQKTLDRLRELPIDGRRPALPPLLPAATPETEISR